MKLLSHVHINGNGAHNVAKYADSVARYAQEHGYSHYVLGCHDDFSVPSTLMCALSRKYCAIPVRFMELEVSCPSKRGMAHLSMLNVPYGRFPGYKNRRGCCIEDLLSYVKQSGCRVVLNHPDSLDMVLFFQGRLDGWEVQNGLHRKKYTQADVKRLRPLTPFTGADWHVWENKGNPELYTVLPDGWLGHIYE